jgi:hypothetical protein
MEFVVWMWHKASVPLFIERFVLPVFAGIVILVAVTNPMRFDVIQRISGTILLISAALFISQTWYKKTAAATLPAASQLPSGQNSGDQQPSNQNSSPPQNPPASPPQKPPVSPPVSQNSKGPNSPNVNVGGNNNTTTVTINSAAQPPQLKQPEFKFRNATDVVTFWFGHGMSFTTSIARLRNGPPWAPMVMGGGAQFSFSMSGETLLVNAKIGAGGEFGPIIEISNNAFAVRDPHFDSNSNEHALEVVTSDGLPVFQLIQKSPTQVVINGISPVGDGRRMTIAGPDGVIQYATDAQLANFHLKPIFKYPAWKYPGEYAD